MGTARSLLVLMVAPAIGVLGSLVTWLTLRRSAPRPRRARKKRGPERWLRPF